MREETVSAWLAKNLDDSLSDLCDAIEGGAAKPEDGALLRDLGELMSRRFVVALDEAAKEIGASREGALAAARRSPDRFGVLEGPPVVLFAHVPADALGRTEV